MLIKALDVEPVVVGLIVISDEVITITLTVEHSF